MEYPPCQSWTTTSIKVRDINAATGRELSPAEAVYSALKPSGAELVREDFSPESGMPRRPPLAWWKSHYPSPDAKRIHWVPNDVMLHLFDQLADQPDQADLRYVLALLLIRRRVMRLEDTERAKVLRSMVLYCPAVRSGISRDDRAAKRAAHRPEIQQELARLLFANAT